jgi:hypothetical protein
MVVRMTSSKITKLVIEKSKEVLLDHLPQILEDSLHDLVEEEVQARRSDFLTKTLENISKKHQIPLEILLYDVPGNEQRCRGKKRSRDGHDVRCMFNATQGGYCKFHQGQCEAIEKRRFPNANTNMHTHGPEQMNVSGCPGCASSNGLIDLHRLMFNE